MSSPTLPMRSASLAKRLSRQLSPRLGVRPVTVASVHSVARAAQTPLRLVPPAPVQGTPATAGAASAAPVVPRPPGLSEFAANWLFGEGAFSSAPVAGLRDEPVAPPDDPVAPGGDVAVGRTNAKHRLARRSARVTEIRRSGAAQAPPPPEPASVAPDAPAPEASDALADPVPAEAAGAPSLPPAAGQAPTLARSPAPQGRPLRLGRTQETKPLPRVPATESARDSQGPTTEVSGSPGADRATAATPAISAAPTAEPATPAALPATPAAPPAEARVSAPAEQIAQGAIASRHSRPVQSVTAPEPPAAPGAPVSAAAAAAPADRSAETAGPPTVGSADVGEQPGTQSAVGAGEHPGTQSSAPAPVAAAILRMPGSTPEPRRPVVRISSAEPTLAASPVEGRPTERPGPLRRLLRAVTRWGGEPIPAASLDAPTGVAAQATLHEPAAATAGATAAWPAASRAEATAAWPAASRAEATAASIPAPRRSAAASLARSAAAPRPRRLRVGDRRAETAGLARAAGAGSALAAASAAPTAAVLAAAPGAMIAREGDRDSVTFAAPPDQSPATAVTPASAEVPAAAPVAGALGATTAAPPPAPAGLEPAAAGPPPAPPRPGPDLEDVYDHVVERLRHDLLAERERMGYPLGDLPR
jgi:hypothetical protein